MSAYDYEAQQWVSGTEARRVRLAQVKTELELLRGARGKEYANFSGVGDREAAIARLKALAEELSTP